VPRTGSAFLGGLLESTGVAGHPHEWFWRETEAELRRKWGVSGDREYVEAVLRAGTTPNGVFAAKMMWAYFEESFARLEPVIPSPRFVWIRREDIVAQAVSWSRAMQGGRWWSGQTQPEKPLEYDFGEIDALVQEAREHDAAWQDWFAKNGIEPFEVRYEKLLADPVGIATATLAFLGLTADPATIAARTERQADELNAEWARRYRSGKWLS
jgi:LPS sulfotransferase NodH